MPRFGLNVCEGEELVGQGGGARNLRGSREPQEQQVEHQAVVLEHERGELQTPNQSEGIDMGHVLEAHAHVVLGGDVIRNVMIHYQTQQPIQQSQVDLLVHLSATHITANHKA